MQEVKEGGKWRGNRETGRRERKKGERAEWEIKKNG
jgi:hypothetical protein